MPAEAQNPVTVSCRNDQGREVAKVMIWSTRKDKGATGEAADLIRLSEAEAEAQNEESVQLRERGRYLYKIVGDAGLSLSEERGVSASPAGDGGGLIEPGDQCGVLPLKLMRGNEVVACGAVEVRSIKLRYREHYRGMLNCIAEKCMGLLLDSRAPTRLRLSSAWKDNRAMLEQQLEFLRHTLESVAFRGAVDEVLRNPHRLLENEAQEQSISRPFKPGRDFVRQLGKAGDRIALPEGHPLRAMHPALTSLPVRIQVMKRTDFLDTGENRFVKMVLVEFRDFLAEVAGMLGRDATDAVNTDNVRLLREVARLRSRLDTLLGRGFLPDVSRPELLPLGSPVLQRKPGYREILNLWLQFHVGAQLAWDGGNEIWRGGARNVATLYEYWLFFQLEALFRSKFECTAPLHSVLVEKDAGLPRLKLQRGIELQSPIGGALSASAKRTLKAEFHFNKKFARNRDHQKGGSWTRGVQPDYTITIWPAEFDRNEAEACDMLVHVHFDAKYRVENVQVMFGSEEDDDFIQDRAATEKSPPTAAKYADLLKMHAYRDAIRRSAGAYVLYPGMPGDGKKFAEFEGFHEVLPGLGAFAIRPRSDGTADGMEALRIFLDEVIEHLSNRTTARERATFHTAESYKLHEAPVPYGNLVLAERDEMSDTGRALPPAEHHVVVAWYNSPEQLEWTLKSGFAVVRLGDRPGSWNVSPEFASARHVLLFTHKRKVADGLLRLKDSKPGYRVFTANDLKGSGYPGAASGEIYAIFEVEPDHAFDGKKWDGVELGKKLEDYEARRSYRKKTLGNRLADPRVLSLRELLASRI
ncbi:DUF2357 domain-containing protein [Prosthecobacter vanneervenii]|uniref:DUF2357 domain-containing protein n=1 Tax=Prosthecobacter vanneervenii TaxID=48466 RepID=A0A7W7Y9K2_9BACT|nr:DUF2357 domain-containing protein [Prosthecobacter vanneervenii]MBB5032126.1 hypothetical protein [Prosthecobacter vanneervenii]